MLDTEWTEQLEWYNLATCVSKSHVLTLNSTRQPGICNLYFNSKVEAVVLQILTIPWRVKFVVGNECIISKSRGSKLTLHYPPACLIVLLK